MPSLSLYLILVMARRTLGALNCRIMAMGTVTSQLTEPVQDFLLQLKTHNSMWFNGSHPRELKGLSHVIIRLLSIIF